MERRDASADGINAHVTMDRLQQKLNGRMPADELAQELADEERGIAGAADARRSLPEGAGGDALAAKQRAIAGALRNLAAPDAQAEQALAVGLAERAAEALAGPDATAKPNPEWSAGCRRGAAAAAAGRWPKIAGRPSSALNRRRRAIRRRVLRRRAGWRGRAGAQTRTRGGRRRRPGEAGFASGCRRCSVSLRPHNMRFGATRSRSLANCRIFVIGWRR